jgi:hypothetical protein
MSSDLLENAVQKPLDRRQLLQRAGVTGLGVAAMTMLGGSLGKLHAATSAITDADIINFALNLEYLEAEFYSVASRGHTLVERGIIPSSAVEAPTTGGHIVPNFGASDVAFIASALRDDEADHVLFLRKALGSAAVQKPAINLDALGFGFGSVAQFLTLAAIFEDVGVSAYLGAAPLIQSKTYLDVAARILATEAQHAGAIRTLSIQKGIGRKPLDSVDVSPNPGHPFDVDSTALSIPRTTSQVLKLVYGGGTSSGGFFPDGLNGTIKSA